MRVSSGGHRIMSCALRKWIVCGFAVVLIMSAGTGARGDSDPAVQRGLAFLEARASQLKTGESAMVALAFIKAEVPASNPGLGYCLAKIRARFASGSHYEPELQGGTEIYEAGVVAM